jgi:hypothetical protein
MLSVWVIATLLRLRIEPHSWHRSPREPRTVMYLRSAEAGSSSAGWAIVLSPCNRWGAGEVTPEVGLAVLSSLPLIAGWKDKWWHVAKCDTKRLVWTCAVETALLITIGTEWPVHGETELTTVRGVPRWPCPLWAEHVARMGTMRIVQACDPLIGKRQWEVAWCLGDSGVDRRIILKWLWRKCVLMRRFRLSALRSSSWCAQPSFGAAAVQYSCDVCRSVCMQLHIMTDNVVITDVRAVVYVVLSRVKETRFLWGISCYHWMCDVINEVCVCVCGCIYTYMFNVEIFFSWEKRPEREPDDTRSNADTDSLTLAYISASFCVFAVQFNTGRNFSFGFSSWSVGLCPVVRWRADCSHVLVCVSLRAGFSCRFVRRAVVLVDGKERICCWQWPLTAQRAVWRVLPWGGNKWHWLFYCIVFHFYLCCGLQIFYFSLCIAMYDTKYSGQYTVSAELQLTAFQPPTGRCFRVCANKKRGGGVHSRTGQQMK